MSKGCHKIKSVKDVLGITDINVLKASMHTESSDVLLLNAGKIWLNILFLEHQYINYASVH